MVGGPSSCWVGKRDLASISDGTTDFFWTYSGLLHLGRQLGLCSRHRRLLSWPPYKPAGQRQVKEEPETPACSPSGVCIT